MSDRRRLTASDIVIGAPLACDVFSEDRKLLLRRGHVVQTSDQMETLLQRGAYTDLSSGDKIIRARQKAPPKEKPSALRFLNLAIQRLDSLLYNLTKESDASSKILEVVKTITRAVDINADITVASILLNQASASYSVRHSVDTALLALQVARAMHRTPDEIQTLMAAALTMNISILSQQDQWRAHEGPLTADEIALIRNHPTNSVAMLRRSGITDEAWLSYVAQHHGNGDAELSQNVKILAFADSYCACVTARKYRKSLLPGAALRDVFLPSGKADDPMLAAYFIKELSTYPPGTMVRLQSGEIGVVTRRGKTPTTPIVHALIGPRGAPLSYPIQRDTAIDLHTVREALPGEEIPVRFSLQQLWGDEAAL